MILDDVFVSFMGKVQKPESFWQTKGLFQPILGRIFLPHAADSESKTRKTRSHDAAIFSTS